MLIKRQKYHRVLLIKRQENITVVLINRQENITASYLSSFKKIPQSCADQASRKYHRVVELKLLFLLTKEFINCFYFYQIPIKLLISIISSSYHLKCSPFMSYRQETLCIIETVLSNVKKIFAQIVVLFDQK